MSRCKILVCDDEPHIVHVVSTKLRNAGYDVVTAADGEEAFEVAREQRPELLITDYQMPGLSGLELCAKLRCETITKSMPVIMLTARGFSLTPDELERTNICRVLPKPFSPREVLEVVHAALGKATTVNT